MKAKRIVTGLAIALVVAVGLALPEAASADRGSGARGGGGSRGAAAVHGGGYHGYPRGARYVGGHGYGYGYRHGYRSSFGVVVGVPWAWGGGWYGGYYPPYYGGYYGAYGYPGYGYPGYGYPGYGYYPPAVVSVPSSPPTYIERGTPDAAPGGSSAYWYYCEQSRTYYPYVKECPGGWKQVTPQAPPQ